MRTLSAFTGKDLSTFSGKDVNTFSGRAMKLGGAVHGARFPLTFPIYLGSFLRRSSDDSVRAVQASG